MNYLKLFMVALALSVSSFAQVDTSSQHFYMFIYFLNSNDQAGARIALSSNAMNWQKINDEKPVLVPIISSEKRMRDPNTYYDSTTGTFHLVWTTGWNQQTIGYATSVDLKTWTPQVALPVGTKITGCTCCWAPEIFYDDIKDSFMVYWSTDRGTNGKRTYYSLTKDFKTFSGPKKFFDPGYSVIDATILKDAAAKYYMFFKDERDVKDVPDNDKTKNIHYIVGKSPQGGGAPDGFAKGTLDIGWSQISQAITDVGCEGPSAIKINNQYLVYFDPFGVFSSTYRMVQTADLNTKTFPWPKGEVLKTSTGEDFLYSHGSISEIPKAKVLQLLYGIADNTQYKASFTPPVQNSDITVLTPPKEVLKYPLGKPNRGCGTGVGLAFFPPILFKAWSLRSRRKKKR